MDRRTPESSLSLSQSDLLSRNSEQRSLPEDLLHSAVYTAVQAPLKGATQLIDKTFNTNMLPSVEFMDTPQNAEFLSARWHVQQVGSAAGMVVPFLLLHKGVGRLSAAALGKVETEMATQTLTRRVIGEAAVTGALYEGVFRPVTEQEGNFAAARARNALVGGATFATLAASAIAIKSLAQAETGTVGRMLRTDIAASVLAGVPAGFVSAEANSLLSGKGSASRGEIAESMYSFALAGGALSLGKAAVGTTRAEGTLRNQMKEQSAAAMAEGAPTLAERAQVGIETAQTRLGALADNLTRPALRPAMAGLGGEVSPGGPLLPDMNAVFMSRSKPLRGGLGQPGQGLLPADILTGMKKGGAAGAATGDGAVVSAPANEVVKPSERGSSTEASPVVEAKPVVQVASAPVEARPADGVVAPRQADVIAPSVVKDSVVVRPADTAPLPAVEKVLPPAKEVAVPVGEIVQPAKPIQVTGQGKEGVAPLKETAPRPEKPEVRPERTPVAKPTSVAQAVDKAHGSYHEAVEAVRVAADRQQVQQRVQAAEAKIERLEKVEDPALPPDELAQWQAKQLKEFQQAQVELDTAIDAQRRAERGGWINPERPIRSVAEAVRTANEAVKLEPSSVKKRLLAKDAGVALEKLLGRIPDGYKGAEGTPDLPRFSDLPANSPSKLDPVQRLNDLNNHLQGRVTALDAAEQARRVELAQQREASANAVLEAPVVKDVLQRAKDGKLHPHPEAIIVFMNGEHAIQFPGAKGKQAGFSQAECANPELLKARLAGQEVTGAVVFTPNKVRLNNSNRTVTQLKLSRVYGTVPKGLGAPTLRDFLDQHGDQR